MELVQPTSGRKRRIWRRSGTHSLDYGPFQQSVSHSTSAISTD